MKVVFETCDTTERQLRELAALESDCCSFATWDVRRSDRDLVLEVSGRPEAVAAIQALLS